VAGDSLTDGATTECSPVYLARSRRGTGRLAEDGKAVVSWLDRWVEVGSGGGSGSGESPAQLPSLRRPRRMTSQGEVVLVLVCQHMSLSRQIAGRCACSCWCCIFWILDSGCGLPPSTAVARSCLPSVLTSTLLLSRGRQGCGLTTRARTRRQPPGDAQRPAMHDTRPTMRMFAGGPANRVSLGHASGWRRCHSLDAPGR
jgi:hypothetical protein